MDETCTNCGEPLNLEVLPCLACGWEPKDATERNALAFRKNELRMAKAKTVVLHMQLTEKLKDEEDEEK